MLNGSKAWITGGGHAKWFFVLARTEADPKCPAGSAFTAFLVDGDAKGVSRGKKVATVSFSFKHALKHFSTF